MCSTTEQMCLKILVLEDSVDDFKLLMRRLHKEGFDTNTLRIDTKEDLQKALKEDWDLIISDYYLPDFDGITCLKMVRETDPITPFILISGEVPETVAIEAIKHGATDYLFKNNLLRLASSVKKSINEMHLKRNKLISEKKIKENEKKLRMAHTLAKSGYWEFDCNTKMIEFSDELVDLFHLEDKKLPLRHFLKWIHSDEVHSILSIIKSADKANTTLDFTFTLLPERNRSMMTIYTRCVLGFDDEGLSEIEGIFQDISEQQLYKQAADEALKNNQTLLKEMHHRVKNNLATITSLLELEKMASECKVTIETLSRNTYHIYNMGILQELLYKSSDFTKVAFDQYLDKLIEITEKNDNPNTNITVYKFFKPIELDISKAFPAAMIASEIIANAFQHPFKNPAKNEIYLELNESDTEVFLTVKDNGIGIDNDFDYTKSNTPGFSLITIFIQQLSGTLNMYNDKGTTAELSFKKLDSKESAANTTLNQNTFRNCL